MDLEGVREALHQRPFKPFAICLADGRRLQVAHPDSVAVGKRRAFVIGPDDSTSLIEPKMIVSLDLRGDPSSEADQLSRSGTQGQSGVTIEQVRQLHEAVPFRSFTIHLADGRQIRVKDREFMAISPSGRTVIVYQSDNASILIDLLLVTDLEVRNGKTPKRHRS